MLPGKEVVCVNDVVSPETRALFNGWPIDGETYVIRDIVPGCNTDGAEGEIAVYLIEFRNPDNARGIERGYNAERFVPLENLPEEEIAEPQITYQPEPAYV